MTTATRTTSDLTADQRESLRRILEWVRSPEAVITLSGYAGTGKTYLTQTIVETLQDAGWNILITAPTHQALGVVRGRSNATASTIHAALGLVVRENADGTTHVTQRTAPKVRGFDLLIVDEASMVGAELYQALMRERDCPVLFVGDPGQLPPIGERESPAFTEVSMRVALTQIVRQADGSSLITLAHRIREEAENGRRIGIESIRPYIGPEAVVMQAPGWQAPAAVAELVTDARAAGHQAVGITYRNADVDRINRAVHEALHPGHPLPYAPGERVLFRSPFHEEGREHEEPIARTNEYASVISVGDPKQGPLDTPTIDLELELQGGRIRTIPTPLHSARWHRAIRALFTEHRAAKAEAKITADPARQNELQEKARLASSRAWFLRSRLADIQHDYAMTAHRSQGSTFDIVVLHWAGLNEMRDDFEHARALYVAATRPSMYLAIVE